MSAALWFALLVASAAAEGGVHISGTYSAPPPDEPDYQDQLTFEAPPPLSDQYGPPQQTQAQVAVVQPQVFAAPPSAAYGAPPPSTVYGAPPPSAAYGAPPPSAAYGAPPPSAVYGAPPPTPAAAYGAPPPTEYTVPVKLGNYIKHGGGPFTVTPFKNDWIITGGLLAVVVVVLSLVGMVSIPFLPSSPFKLPDISLNLFDKPLGAAGRELGLSEGNLTELADQLDTMIEKAREFIANYQQEKHRD